MTTKTSSVRRTSLFPRTPAEAAADAMAAAHRAVTRTTGERAVAALTAAGRRAEARYPALRRALKPARPRSLGPMLPESELYGCALACEGELKPRHRTPTRALFLEENWVRS